MPELTPEPDSTGGESQKIIFHIDPNSSLIKNTLYKNKKESN
jgi:hypothetical protein